MKKLIALLMTVALVACTTNDPYTGERKTSKTTKGAGIGAVTGAVLGAAASSKKDRTRGALVGAIVGGAIGGSIGHYMDNQEKELRERLQGSGVQLSRHGDELTLIMPGNITFATGQSAIRSDFFNVLNSVSIVLKKYDKTDVRISGHTDSTGSIAVNQRLSEERANSVRSYLVAQQIPGSRIEAIGYGSNDPIASNATDEGRQANRRVEINLIPHE